MKVMSTIIAIGLLAAAGAAGKSERISEPIAPSGQAADEIATSNETSAVRTAEQEKQATMEWRYSPAVPYVAPKVPI